MGPCIKKQIGTQDTERLGTQDMECLHALCDQIGKVKMYKYNKQLGVPAFPVTGMALQDFPLFKDQKEHPAGSAVQEPQVSRIQLPKVGHISSPSRHTAKGNI